MAKEKTESKARVALKTWRLRAGLLQYEASAEIECRESEYCAVEGGKRIPGRRLALKFARKAGVDVAWWDEGATAGALADLVRLEERAARAA